ncbi:MAG: LytTR family DNA-binding domain-containing protein [Gammaproteobacteria bacterium]|nr:LytTR family DNA-binding domain-containing protein [Gammaproteobacteria bacterium]
MRILIVDDEAPARVRLRRMLEDAGEHEVVAEAGNGEQALRLNHELSPDAILLDIRMPGMDGLECARHLSTDNEGPAVIFTTAYDQYAIEAFEAHALGYLLKPVRQERLHKALQHARRLSNSEAASIARASQAQARQFICAVTRGEAHLVPVTNVLYFEADQKYVSMIHPGGAELIDESLKMLEEEFSESFVRIHRSFLVSLDWLEALEKGPTGHFQVRLREKEEKLPVSRRMVSELRKRMRHN